MAKEKKQEEKPSKKFTELKNKLDTCKKEKDEYLEGWKRAKADYLNYKAEEEQRNEKAKQRIKEAIFEDIIPVLDSLDLGLAMNENREKAEKKGMEAVRNQLRSALERHGLEEMKVKIGDELDTGKHEAVGEIDSSVPEGRICKEQETGYLLGERVLRPAKVFVSKKKAEK